MPKNVTLAELRAAVRFRGDFDNSRAITDANLNLVINDGVAEAWDILLAARPDYYTTSTSTTYAANASSVTLPTTFYQLRKVEYLDGTDYVRLAPVELTAQHRFGGAAGVPSRYRLQGSTLVLVPTPSKAYTLRIWYLPYATTLANDSDTFDGINGYEELAIACAVYRLKLREGLPVEEWLREVNRQTAAIRAAAANHDASEPIPLNPDGRAPDGADWTW